MSILVPAVLPSSKQDLDEKLAKFEGVSSVSQIQIDVIDGIFAKPPSWPYNESDVAHALAGYEMLPRWGDIIYDIDLMVKEPESAIDAWIKLGARRLTLHAESTNDLPGLLERVKDRYGHAQEFAPALIALGLAVNVDSDLALIEPFAAAIDYVQLMGIAHIGRQGEPFDQRVVDKVKELRRRHEHLFIQIDGGVSLTTAPALLSAGADRLVVGSALAGAADLPSEIDKFEQLGMRYGLFERR